MRYKIRVLTFIVTVIISVCFLIYMGKLYFETYSLAYGVRVSIKNLVINTETLSVNSDFLIENPSAIDFKITYIKEEVYIGSKMLGVHIKRNLQIKVGAFSNVSISVTVKVDEIFLDGKLFIKLFMYLEDIPITGSMYLSQHFGPL